MSTSFRLKLHNFFYLLIVGGKSTSIIKLAITFCCCYLKFADLLVVIHRSEKEMNRRKDMLANLRTKVNQMASTLNMSNFANRDSLLGTEIKPANAMSRAVSLDNSGLVGFQRQVMKGKLLTMLSILNPFVIWYSLCFSNMDLYVVCF